MKYNYRFTLTALLLLSGTMLSSLVPGGPIENREFAHINPLILTGFNLFLTVLGLGSFILAFYVWKEKRWAMKLSLLAALSYVLVYGVDLLGWFPQSPTLMSAPLFWIEVIGLIIAIPLAGFSWIAISNSTDVLSTDILNKKISLLKVIGLTLAGVAIVTFATLSAIQSGS